MFLPPKHKQEIYFNDGSIRVIENIKRIEQGRWFHLLTEDDKEYVINPQNVLFVRVTK